MIEMWHQVPAARGCLEALAGSGGKKLEAEIKIDLSRLSSLTRRLCA
jgi:hypothetical protein